MATRERGRWHVCVMRRTMLQRAAWRDVLQYVVMLRGDVMCCVWRDVLRGDVLRGDLLRGVRMRRTVWEA